MLYMKDIRAANKRAKYGNRKTAVDGIEFDSAREANRYAELKLMEKAGEISCLDLQTPFELIPAQLLSDGSTERSCTYVADFSYWQDGRFIVEDAKGKRTSEYIIKRKLMKQVHNIEIREV